MFCCAAWWFDSSSCSLFVWPGENSTQSPITAHESFKATWCHHARRQVTKLIWWLKWQLWFSLVTPMSISNLDRTGISFCFKWVCLSSKDCQVYLLQAQLQKPSLTNASQSVTNQIRWLKRHWWTVPQSSPAEEFPRVQLLRDINKETNRNNCNLIRHSDEL